MFQSKVSVRFSVNILMLVRDVVKGGLYYTAANSVEGVQNMIYIEWKNNMFNRRKTSN